MMPKNLYYSLVLMLCAVLAGCLQISLPVNAQNTLELDSTTLQITTVANNLSVPWEILWGPDNWIWLTERAGSISRLNPETGDIIEIYDIPDCYEQQESGLLGMVLHPDFPTTPYLYVAYTYLQGFSITERLVRYTYNGTTLIDPLILLDNIPGNSTHDGCRLLISPDNKLFMTTGDAQDQTAPQNVTAINGKLLRMNLDGSVPADNPIPGSLVWSWGHRNAQGLVLASNGIMYSSEHGPTNDDEFNIIYANRNYGWPTVQGFCNTPTETAFCNANNIVEPLAAWTPTLAVAGIDYYNHPAIPEWQNAVLMTVMKSQRLVRLRLSPDGTQLLDQTNYLQNQFGRIRDICISPIGDVYISTTNRDAYGSGQPDRIIRLHNPNYMVLPQANFAFADSCLTVTFTNLSTQADSFVWNFGGGYTSTAESPVFTFLEAGTYTVELIATNPYTSDTLSIDVMVQSCLPDAIEEPILTDADLRTYPNPASGFVNMDFPATLAAATLEMANLKGQIVYKTVLGENTNTLKIPLTGLPEGVYILTILKNKTKISKKITVK